MNDSFDRPVAVQEKWRDETSLNFSLFDDLSTSRPPNLFRFVELHTCASVSAGDSKVQKHRTGRHVKPGCRRQ